MPRVGSAIAVAAAADATAVDCPLIDDDCWMTVATLLLTHTVRTPGCSLGSPLCTSVGGEGALYGVHVEPAEWVPTK